jgi:hypothetical protein
MSAAEVIELIKKLPPQERAEVVAFVKNESLETSGVKVAPDADFERAAKRVMTENRELLRRLAQ